MKQTSTANAGYTLKDLYNLIRSSKCERPYTRTGFAPLTKSPDSELGKPPRISPDDNKQDFFIAILEQRT